MARSESPFIHTAPDICEKKPHYPNKKAATKAAHALRYKYGKLFPYPCTVCGRWALSTRSTTFSTEAVDAALDKLKRERESRA